MLSMLLNWVFSALVLFIIANIMPGIAISNFGVALFATFMLGLVNVLVKPLLVLLTLPINILTMGLFSFVLNALMFALAAWMVPGFEVSNFWTALLGSALLAFLTGLTSRLTSDEKYLPNH